MWNRPPFRGIAPFSHGESRVLCHHLVETEIEVFGVFLPVLIETCVMHLRSETSRKVK